MLEINIKSTILDRPRKLTINSDLIEFDNATLVDTTITSFTRGEVFAFRFGVEFIWGYNFVMGRKYCIDIKGHDERVIKIRLVSLYGIRRKALHAKFNQILHAFFHTHQRDMINYYLEIFNSDITVNILETSFDKAGVIINKQQINWENLGTKAYTTYYALFSKTDPTIYKSYNYREDWNTAVIYNFSRQILANKGLL